MASFKIIIPARYASTRLPGKPLLEIAGKPLLQHVYETACQSKASEVCIATDDERIAKACEAFDAEVIMTSSEHVSGTDRLAEVIEKQGDDDNSIVVNLQGDELGMSPVVINQVAHALIKNAEINMATVCERIETASEVLDPNIVKVVFDANNLALYFSRAPIPWQRSGNMTLEQIEAHIQQQAYYRHIGLYAYRAGFLKQYPSLPKCELEERESLEQLRVLYQGERIHVSLAQEATGIGVDTEQDLAEARERLTV